MEKQWKVDIINNLLKIGISNSLENNIIRFREEHNLIINQIKYDIEVILSGDENNNSGKNLNNFNLMDESKKDNNNDNYKNLFINKKKNNENENNS